MSLLAKELDALLSQDVDRVLETQRGYWKSVTGSLGGRVVLFGAGALGRRTLAGVRQAGIEALAFADNGTAFWGKEVDGLPVLRPEEAVSKYGDSAVFVLTTYNTSGPRQQLACLGAHVAVHYALLFASKPEAFLPHQCLELPHPIFEQAAEVRKGFELMADDEMRRIYIEQLRLRLFLDFDRAPSPQTRALRDSEYFPDDLYAFLPDEVLVDCGAYDGDTVRRFIAKRAGSFAKIHACEPDPDNRARFKKWSSALPEAIRTKIDVEPVALGACRGKVRFAATGTAESLVDGTGAMEIDVATIDEITQLTPPTLIKMDIEGAELDALMGARRVISEHTPVLAICVYHTSDHLWRVPLLIASMSSRYCFYLRAHAEDCWDVSCYAVPKARLVRE